MTSTPEKQKVKRSSMTEVRKERRRTTDREAQRASRARTKKRIEELESMVESLLANQGDDRVNMLSRQLEEQREKNRTMVASLTAIQKVLTNAPPDQTCPNVQDDHKMHNHRNGSGSVDSDSDPSDEPVQTSQHSNGAESGGMKGRGGYWKDVKELLSGQTLNQKVTKATILPLAGLHHATSSSWQDLDSGWIAARNTRLPPAWEVVNTALINAIFLMSQVKHVDTSMDGDIAVRAVLHGWADVETSCVLDVGWKLLQEIDQYVFFQCSPVTRMAILRIMRLELLHKINATRDPSKVPDYLAPRAASAVVDHPVLVDFFVWPDLRDHMMLSPSIYIANNFGRLFSKSLRFLWPESMTDAWAMGKSGNYEFSGLFEQRFQEVHCWSLSMDFFMEYPQVIGLVPMYNPLPRGLSGSGQSAAPHLITAANGTAHHGVHVNGHGHGHSHSHSHSHSHGHGSNTNGPGGFVEEFVADEWDANAAEANQAAQAGSFLDDGIFA